MKDYDMKREEALRELAILRDKLLSKNCSVDLINRAFKLRKVLGQI